MTVSLLYSRQSQYTFTNFYTMRHPVLIPPARNVMRDYWIMSISAGFQEAKAIIPTLSPDTFKLIYLGSSAPIKELARTNFALKVACRWTTLAPLATIFTSRSLQLTHF
ncbi:hypothetical protein TWF970_002700 [Orbilia oligospora]|uniref:Uncharacterized protein n=1 Tax=Orbilia oligospora TaxID=2813651 RepID=A0A7C8RF09_ORBOL|nr:hypothetical protein TWF970_002700 [Orbilia oligospora]